MTETALSVRAAYIDDDELGRVWFGSVDGGELWLEFNRRPTPEDGPAMKQRFDGNGRTQPIRMHRRWLDQHKAVFVDD